MFQHFIRQLQPLAASLADNYHGIVSFVGSVWTWIVATMSARAWYVRSFVAQRSSMLIGFTIHCVVIALIAMVAFMWIVIHRVPERFLD